MRPESVGFMFANAGHTSQAARASAQAAGRPCPPQACLRPGARQCGEQLLQHHHVFRHGPHMWSQQRSASCMLCFWTAVCVLERTCGGKVRALVAGQPRSMQIAFPQLCRQLGMQSLTGRHLLPKVKPVAQAPKHCALPLPLPSRCWPVSEARAVKWHALHTHCLRGQSSLM